MTTPTYPPGKTWFTTAKKSYIDVTIDSSKDNAIWTTDFLDANESLLGLFDLLGGTGFSIVTNDLKNNIKKVRTRQLAAPGQSETVQDLVRNEIAENGKNVDKNTATQGLLWLLRGLEFASVSLGTNLQKPEKELAACFQEGYGSTLSNHHGKAVQIVVKPLLGSLPYRKNFYAKLGNDPAEVETDMKPWADSFQKIIDVLQSFMASPNVQNGLPKEKKGWF